MKKSTPKTSKNGRRKRKLTCSKLARLRSAERKKERNQRVFKTKKTLLNSQSSKLTSERKLRRSRPSQITA